MKFNRVLIVLLFVVFGFQSFAQFNLSQPIAVDPNVKIGKLANGLTYYIRKNTNPSKKIIVFIQIYDGILFVYHILCSFQSILEIIIYNTCIAHVE